MNRFYALLSTIGLTTTFRSSPPSYNDIAIKVFTGLVSQPRFAEGPDRADRTVRIDSRYWDPNWKYRNDFTGLYNLLRYSFSHVNASNIASFESYTWGRGGTPVLRFASFVNPQVAAERMQQLFDRLRQSILNLDVREFLNTVADPGPTWSSYIFED